MRGPVSIAMSKRVTVLTFGCVLSLGIAGCSNTIGGTATSTSDQPVTTTNGSAYSVQNALATLPSHEDDEPLTVVTADLASSARQLSTIRMPYSRGSTRSPACPAMEPNLPRCSCRSLWDFDSKIC